MATHPVATRSSGNGVRIPAEPLVLVHIEQFLHLAVGHVPVEQLTVRGDMGEIRRFREDTCIGGGVQIDEEHWRRHVLNP